MAAPDVNDRLTVKHNGNRGANVGAFVQTPCERLGHPAEPLIDFALDFGHATHPIPVRPASASRFSVNSTAPNNDAALLP